MLRVSVIRRSSSTTLDRAISSSPKILEQEINLLLIRQRCSLITTNYRYYNFSTVADAHAEESC